MNKQMTPTQEFDRQLVGLKSRLSTAVTPAGMDAVYFMTMTSNYITQNPGLLQCKRSSLLTAIIRAARCGLVLDQATGHANILKFGDEAVFAPGYPGLIHLAKKHANAADVRARAVYENDEFDFVMGYDERITHRPWTVLGKAAPGRVIGYYAIIEYKDGFKRGEFIAADEVQHIKAQALRRSKNTGPWADPYGEVRMGVKTAIIRLFKQIDKSPQLKLAVDAAEDSDAETSTMPAEDAVPAEVVSSKAATIAGSIRRDPTDTENADAQLAADPAEPPVTPPASVEPDVLTRGDKLFVRMLGSKRVMAKVADMNETDLRDARDAAEATLHDPAASDADRSRAAGVIVLLEDEAARRVKA